jgi:hypothetical protein
VAVAILARALTPFQRQLPAWPERAQAVLATADAMLHSPLQEVSV